MDSNQWIDATAVDDVPEDDVIGVLVDGRDIALYNAGGEIFATDNICTHGQARLCEGFLEGHEIECPLHQGRFDVRTGRPTGPPVTEAIRSYPVRVEAGRVLLALDQSI
jgi:naphthalene 1,2-dioxygenase system ferredoxin subunit